MSQEDLRLSVQHHMRSDEMICSTTCVVCTNDGLY